MTGDTGVGKSAAIGMPCCAKLEGATPVVIAPGADAEAYTCSNPALGPALSRTTSDLPHRQSLAIEGRRDRAGSRITQRANALVHAIHTPNAFARHRWTPSIGTGGCDNITVRSFKMARRGYAAWLRAGLRDVRLTTGCCCKHWHLYRPPFFG